MESKQCPCGNFRRKPVRGCNTCDPATADEKAADVIARQTADKIARTSSIERILGFWDNGRGTIELLDPTTVRVGDYYFGFDLGGIGSFGDISSKDHPELNVMVNDLMERFKDQLAPELYKK